MERWKKSGSLKLPADLVYNNAFFPSLSNEELEKLNRHRPDTLHMASQIQGVTPFAVLHLHNYLTRGRYQQQQGKGKGEGEGKGKEL